MPLPFMPAVTNEQLAGEIVALEQHRRKQGVYLHIVLVELRHQAAGQLVHVQRHEVGECGRCDHHPAGMAADRQALAA